MADYEKLAKEVEKLSLPEVAEFVKFLEERWGVSAAAPMIGAMPVAAAGAAAAEEDEQTEFVVILQEIGPEKIKVIKAAREVNSELGLKEAKEVVESVPANIVEGVSKEVAEAAKKTLEEAGATVVIK